MKTQRKIFRGILFLFFIVISTSAAVYIWTVVLPQHAIESLVLRPRAADSDETLRDLSHRLMQYPWNDPHDPCIYLATVGNFDSVGYLLTTLQRLDVSEAMDDAVECTVVHCMDALRRITGRDEGYNLEKWTIWWKENGSKADPTIYPVDPIKIPKQKDPRPGSKTNLNSPNIPPAQ